MIVMTLVLAGLSLYANASQRSTVAYANQRDERYAGDAAIKAAVNWAKDQSRVGRDPELDSTDPACVFHATTEVGDVTASCAAEPGSGSGEPDELGLVPPEGLLALGTRKLSNTASATADLDEPGPYNVPDCRGWWDTFAGWFQSGVDPNATGPGEWGVYFRGRKGLGFANATCNTDRGRKRSNFKVSGDLVAAGHVQVENFGGSGQDNTVTVVNGQTYADHGCSGGGFQSGVPANPNYCNPDVPNRSGFTDALAYLNGTSRATDPGRANPSSPGRNPTDIATPFQAVGFNSDGSLKAQSYAPTTLMPSALPVRTTAYVLNPSTGAVNATAGCVNAATTLIFLPGWYQDADVVNRYTATNSASCKDVTYWFAPDPGPDGQLLTDDDKTGPFLMDFRTGAGQGCADMPTNSARWCIGTVADQNARVVVGTPKGWAPIGSAVTGGSDPRPRIAVSINRANTVDEDLSQSWFNSNRAQVNGDGQAARYHADICIIWCFSVDRAIRLRDFTPDVTAPPIDEPGAPNGRIYLDVTYGVTHPGLADPAAVEVKAVGQDSGERNCGSYPLFTNPSQADYASGLHTYTFNAAQAKQLADTCGTVDLINGYELTLKVTGNPFNVGGGTDVYLDGMTIRYETFQGANFPNPVGGSGLPQAQSDCDPTLPGGQIIFNGDSHLYVGDGSLEVCAGPYPDDPENHMAIGVYSLPAVGELYPTGITGSWATNNYDPPSNPDRVTEVDNYPVTINYGGCAAYCGRSYEEGTVTFAMPSYSPPSGYEIAKVEARVAYNPKNQGCSFLWDCPGRNPQLQFPSGTCGGKDFPKNPDQGQLQVANWTTAVLYDGSGGVGDCTGPTELASGLSLRWAARADCVYTFILGDVCKAGGGQWHDEFDGLALQITLRPTGGAARLIPANGCTVAHPNYDNGSGRPDCAVIRADTNSFADNFSWPWDQKEGMLRGRFSVKGTIYAPSAAMEIDDTDVAYPAATRGVVVRHLRMSGWGFRPGYDGVAIDTSVDKTPAPRDATFVSCIQTAARQTADEPCDADDGDRILTRARVRFAVTPPSSPTDEGEANVPQIQWWTDER